MLKSHNKVFGVWVVYEMKPVAQAIKKGVPMPNKDELNKMLAQGWTILCQVSTNEQMYGKVESVIVNHEKIRGLIVPLDKRHYYMAIGCAKPCDADVIMKNAELIMAEA